MLEIRKQTRIITHKLKRAKIKTPNKNTTMVYEIKTINGRQFFSL